MSFSWPTLWANFLDFPGSVSGWWGCGEGLHAEAGGRLGEAPSSRHPAALLPSCCSPLSSLSLSVSVCDLRPAHCDPRFLPLGLWRPLRCCVSPPGLGCLPELRPPSPPPPQDPRAEAKGPQAPVKAPLPAPGGIRVLPSLPGTVASPRMGWTQRVGGDLRLSGPLPLLSPSNDGELPASEEARPTAGQARRQKVCPHRKLQYLS